MSVLPWYENPFRLISWWDMEKFAAVECFQLGKTLEYIIQITQKWKKENPGDSLYPEAVEILKERFGDALKLSQTIGLKITEKTCQDAIAATKEGMEFDEISHWIRSVGGNIRREMENHLFFWVPPQRSSAYTEEPYFGTKVHNKFRAARYDISESAKCFAFGRWTATVLHAMRVLEFGLDSIGEDLGVKRGTRGWGQDLNNFTNKWDQNIKGWKPGMQPLGWRRTFYPKVFKEFGYYEHAWRNHAVHAHTRYDDEEAERVLGHVKTTMQLIANKLKQSKTSRAKP